MVGGRKIYLESICYGVWDWDPILWDISVRGGTETIEAQETWDVVVDVCGRRALTNCGKREKL